MTTTQITYRIDTRNMPVSRRDEFFRVALRDLKAAGFKFDPDAKTWTGDADADNFGIRKGLNRGFLVVV